MPRGRKGRVHPCFACIRPQVEVEDNIALSCTCCTFKKEGLCKHMVDRQVEEATLLGVNVGALLDRVLPPRPVPPPPRRLLHVAVVMYHGEAIHAFVHEDIETVINAALEAAPVGEARILVGNLTDRLETRRTLRPIHSSPTVTGD